MYEHELAAGKNHPEELADIEGIGLGIHSEENRNA